MLKSDTQGFDLDVLLGAKVSLKNGIIENILVELNFVKMYEGQSTPEDIIHFLKENGLFLVDYYEKVMLENHTLAWCTALFRKR